MAERLRCEFALVRYVPDPVKGEFANIGVLLREQTAAAGGTVRFTRDWGRVRCLHPEADTGLLEGLEAELAARLGEVAGADGYPRPLLALLEDSLSNSVQITPLQATLAESLPAELEQLMRLYVEPLRAAGTGTRRRPTGRARLQAEMRGAFEAAGVWGLLRKRIAAAEYTRAGDPLRLDCGYRNGAVRLFQAVSLEADAEAAKGLAYSAGALRAGVERAEGKAMELTAIVEPRSAVDDEELYAFSVDAMEREQIRVLTAADLERVAAVARRELRG